MNTKISMALRTVTALTAFTALPSIAQAYDIAAAQAAAGSVDCLLITPFYWEIGDLHAGAPSTGTDNVIVSGNPGLLIGRNTELNIASASKWIFGTYVLEKFGGIPSNPEVNRGLRRLTGYIHFNQTLCALSQSVAGCFEVAHIPYADYGYSAAADGSTFDPPDPDGPFYYSGGDDQYIGATQTIGSTSIADMSDTALTLEMKTTLNLPASSGMKYQYPAIPGGLQSSAGDYAHFLQKIMHGDYVMSAHLGEDAVATQVVTGTPPNETAACPSGLGACSPAVGVAFHYSYNHWIEDNQSPGQIELVPGVPLQVVSLGVGDGAYSSPGAYGFYPWISHDKQYYGVISRHGTPFGYEQSLKCGQQIRKAFFGEQ